jgi:hypothetical protein
MPGLPYHQNEFGAIFPSVFDTLRIEDTGQTGLVQLFFRGSGD